MSDSKYQFEMEHTVSDTSVPRKGTPDRGSHFRVVLKHGYQRP